jgi:chromosome segregation ATPase
MSQKILVTNEQEWIQVDIQAVAIKINSLSETIEKMKDKEKKSIVELKEAKEKYEQCRDEKSRLECEIKLVKEEETQNQQTMEDLIVENNMLKVELDLLKKQKDSDDNIGKDFEIIREYNEVPSAETKELKEKMGTLHSEKQSLVIENSNLKFKLEDLQTELLNFDRQKYKFMDSTVAEAERLFSVIQSASIVFKTQITKVVSDSKNTQNYPRQTPRFLTTPRSQNLFTEQANPNADMLSYSVTSEIDRFINIIDSALIIAQSQIQRIIDSHETTDQRETTSNTAQQTPIIGTLVPPSGSARINVPRLDIQHMDPVRQEYVKTV